MNETKHFWFYLITILFLYKNKYDIFSSSAIKQIFFLPTKTSLQKGEKRLGIYSIKKKQLIPNEIKTALNSYDRIPSHLTDWHIITCVWSNVCIPSSTRVRVNEEKKEKALTVFKSRALHGGCFETRIPSLSKKRGKRARSACTWVHVAVLRPLPLHLREEGLQRARVERGARYGAHPSSFSRALPQGDGGDGTVGIRDMCVPTHAAYTEKSRVWKEKSITEGKEKEGGGERRWGGKGRTYGCPRPP